MVNCSHKIRCLQVHGHCQKILLQVLFFLIQTQIVRLFYTRCSSLTSNPPRYIDVEVLCCWPQRRIGWRAVGYRAGSDCALWVTALGFACSVNLMLHCGSQWGIRLCECGPRRPESDSAVVGATVAKSDQQRGPGGDKSDTAREPRS